MTANLERPTLDMLSWIRAEPNRKKLATVACWILAAGSLIGLVLTLLDWDIYLRRNRDLHLGFVMTLLGAFAASTALCTGVVLLGFADLARGHANSWPRRCLVVLALVAGISMFVADVLMIRSGNAWTWGRPPSAAFFWQSRFEYVSPFNIWQLSAMSAFSAALVFALIYTLQLSRWLRSLALALVSIFVFTACFAVSAGMLVWMVLLLWFWPDMSRITWQTRDLIVSALSIGQIAVAILLFLYFALLAIMLARKSKPGNAANAGAVP